ncbi:hypothetical protein [Paenibacillus shenyangensis]|uniref:hypothetical protein n=1 Tax=Paenibacillus sp. A9 TaxID=1284352 RepID=UPI00035D2755|nr:hypothetical protein [Paenibacillus sp. A9]
MKIAKIAAASVLTAALMSGASSVFASSPVSVSADSPAITMTDQSKPGSKYVTLRFNSDQGPTYAYSDAEGYVGTLRFVERSGVGFIYAGNVFFQ